MKESRRVRESRAHGSYMAKRLARRQWLPERPGEKPFNWWLNQNPFQISIQRRTLRDHSSQLRPKERTVLNALVYSPLVTSEILQVMGCALPMLRAKSGQLVKTTIVFLQRIFPSIFLPK